MTSFKRSPLLSARVHLLQSPSEGISIVFTCIKRSLHKRNPYERSLNVVIIVIKSSYFFQQMIERCETLIITILYSILSCVVLLRRQIHISLESFKPVEPVLNGQPVLRWLNWISKGQYLPSLSINYVAINNDIVKRSPLLYYIKMKVCYD